MADATEREKIYFAGFFDGEGCVAIYPRYGSYNVSLTNTQTGPLLLARDLWGGYISRHPASRRAGAILDLWRWTLHGHASRPFLEDILPYTLVKQEQIRVFLSALDVMPKSRGQRREAGSTAIIEAADARLRLLKREVA